MAKSLLIAGTLIMLYSIVAEVTGIRTLVDFLPVHWISDVPEGAVYHKVVATNETSYLWLYPIGAGGVIAAIGGLLLYRKH